jgi:hypothetical protein
MAMQASDVVEREIHEALEMHPAAATGDDVELQVLLAGRASVSRIRTRTRDTRKAMIILRRLTLFSQLPLCLLRAACVRPRWLRPF